MSEKNKKTPTDTFEMQGILNDKDLLFQRIDAYVKENIGDMNSISVKSIARRFNISVGYISKLYKRNTDSNFISHVLCLKVEEAKKKLAENPSLKIKDVASMLGYYNPISFTRLFKRFTGMSPLEYRRKFLPPSDE